MGKSSVKKKCLILSLLEDGVVPLLQAALNQAPQMKAWPPGAYLGPL